MRNANGTCTECGADEGSEHVAGCAAAIGSDEATAIDAPQRAAETASALTAATEVTLAIEKVNGATKALGRVVNELRDLRQRVGGSFAGDAILTTAFGVAVHIEAGDVLANKRREMKAALDAVVQATLAVSAACAALDGAARAPERPRQIEHQPEAPERGAEPAAEVPPSPTGVSDPACLTTDEQYWGNSKPREQDDAMLARMENAMRERDPIFASAPRAEPVRIIDDRRSGLARVVGRIGGARS